MGAVSEFAALLGHFEGRVHGSDSVQQYRRDGLAVEGVA
jgi:hypothetical protein